MYQYFSLSKDILNEPEYVQSSLVFVYLPNTCDSSRFNTAHHKHQHNCNLYDDEHEYVSPDNSLHPSLKQRMLMISLEDFFSILSPKFVLAYAEDILSDPRLKYFAKCKAGWGTSVGVERFEIWVKKGFLGVKKCI